MNSHTIWVRSHLRSVSLPQALLPSVNIYLCGRAFSFCLWHICGCTSATVQRSTVRALVSAGDIRINPCSTDETRRTKRERLSVNLASPSSSPPNTNPHSILSLTILLNQFMPGLHHTERHYKSLSQCLQKPIIIVSKHKQKEIDVQWEMWRKRYFFTL